MTRYACLGANRCHGGQERNQLAEATRVRRLNTSSIRTSATGRSAEHTFDIHTTAGKLADLRERSEEARASVGEAAVE